MPVTVSYMKGNSLINFTSHRIWNVTTPDPASTRIQVIIPPTHSHPLTATAHSHPTGASLLKHLCIRRLVVIIFIRVTLLSAQSLVQHICITIHSHPSKTTSCQNHCSISRETAIQIFLGGCIMTSTSTKTEHITHFRTDIYHPRISPRSATQTKHTSKSPYTPTPLHFQNLHLTQTSEKGNLVHKCYVPKCTSKPVKRPFDLERHFTTVHGKGNTERYFCDYSKCKHKEAFDRKDHCREHYREYHREDLVKKTHRDVVLWLQDRNVVAGWWRCSKCLKRNQTESGWKCGGGCNQMCERSRITARNSRVQAPESTEEAEQPAAAGASQPFVQGCGNCESGWFPDEANPHNWVACLVCKPEASEEMVTW